MRVPSGAGGVGTSQFPRRPPGRASFDRAAGVTNVEARPPPAGLRAALLSQLYERGNGTQEV
eukprot:scaffold77440_cov69-Phaeocystis_antarctica.AAC.1